MDDEVMRAHSLTLLQFWVHRCQDHVRSVDQEATLLLEMEKCLKNGGIDKHGAVEEASMAKVTPPRFKPTVITRDMLQVQTEIC